jgi:hypothetical protein
LIIIWVITTTIWCSWVITTIFCIIASCGAWIGAVSSCGVFISTILCIVWVVFRQIHGLHLSLSVHPSSSIVATVVVIIILLLGFLLELHEHWGVLWLHRLLLCGHLLRSGHLLLPLLHMHLLRVLNLTGWSTGALAGGLPGSGHL